MTVNNSDQQLIDYAVTNLMALEKLAQFFSIKNTQLYSESIGGHIRHIIEHYESLIFRESAQVNYDLRKRDEYLEQNVHEVIRRIRLLVKELHEKIILQIQETVSVSCSGGSHGEYLFTNQSSVGRELCFLNSHCIHHLAIIKPICHQIDIPLDEYFGYAPSTIAYLESQKSEAL